MVKAFYVINNQVFDGTPVSAPEKDIFTRSTKIRNAEWLAICPHRFDEAASNEGLAICPYCREKHGPYINSEVVVKQVLQYFPGQKEPHIENAAASVAVWEYGNPLPSCYLIAVPRNKRNGSVAVVLWRIEASMINGVGIKAPSRILTLAKNTGMYKEHGELYSVVEVLALIGVGEGMSVVGKNFSGTLVWTGKEIEVNFTPSQRVSMKVEEEE